ncbi:uncharacterized protein LOC126687338 isoform X2 [Mercurialis annua]|uniref:uncharacterized protein LOC126687338 isoform X2 n=1 Tax=Mercurialis annua TaxID=3986 RepID=UPI00215E3D1B|nr:uncharacterized protein LOC126687338 isoform X2 [Mercurialis annua]
MPTPLPLLLFIFSFLINAPPNHADLILEDGYTVTTVIDGHKLKISPHSVLPRSHLSDLVLLDSSRSAFYTLSFPISQDSVINRLSGDSVPGFSDGEAGSARFNKPKSFAVDNKGNVYVADRNNGAIRKITDSGRTSTIAGGYSKGVGREDGLAQNATFSSDFDLAFVAQECALLISDHGNQLVRRIDLKPDDCASGSKQSAMGAVPIWVLGPGLVLSCLIGVAIGFVVRPHIAPHTGRLRSTSLERDMEALPNQSGETSTDVLLRHQKRNC